MAPIGKRTVSSLPPQAQLTAQKLERLGFTGWVFKEDHPLPDPAGGLQVRDGSSLAPAANVALYAENMKAGDLFPPVVVTADGYQIDGKTRNLAKRSITRRGQTPSFDAIVLRESFAEAGESTALMDRFYSIGMVLNNHGEKLSDKNKEAIIARVWHDGMSQADLARLLNVHPNTVKAVVNAKKARERLEELNEAQSDKVDTASLNRTVLSTLETKGSKLYDKPFYETARVAIQAGMHDSEVRDLLGELNELHDEDKQLELLQGVRDQRRLQISGVAKKNPLTVQAMREFTWLRRYADDPTVLSPSNDSTETKERFVREGYEAISVIRKAIAPVEADLSKEK